MAATMVRSPVDIEQDVHEMERRKRVEVIMNSQVFREELERIIDGQLNEGYLPASLSALHQVTELLLPHNARNSFSQRFGSQSSTPINDIRGVEAFRYVKGEKLIRCKVASVYRLVDLYGWSAGIYNHITVRLSQDQEHFLLNPFGLQYHEVTASSLIKVDLQGNVIDPGSTNFGFNKAGYVLHSAIHAARPDIKAIIHIHHPPCVAVSSMKCGLLPISQEAAIIGEVSYHDYRGLLVDTDERELITKNLGVFNKVLMLRNHGVVACGESLEEALHLVHNIISACETQIRLMPVGLDNIQLMSPEAVEQVRQVIRQGGGLSTQAGQKTDQSIDNADGEGKRPTKAAEDKPRKWKVWDLEFEAQMRMLDNAGYRTGYLYRQPLLRVDQQRIKYDVEIPPSTTSSNGQYLDEDKWLAPLRKLIDHKKTQDKLRWINSPNTYQKVEVLETGTSDPKKITKWVQDGDSPSHSNPIKIDSPHQFVPLNHDASEFKKKQKEMKAVRLQNKISSGPQSNILEGVSWEEVKGMRGDVKSNNDQVVMVGAASKGIIQREYQHNATVYKSAYARNPFDNVTEQELDDYKNYVAKKQAGLPVDELPDDVRHLLMEPVAQRSNNIASPQDPRSPISDEEGDSALNGEDSKIDMSGASRSSKDGSPTKDLSENLQSDKSTSKKGDKDKKKKGIRTPSFLKSKKKKKEDQP